MAVVKPVQVLIIGSGPAGVSAAWPLVEAGLEVHMLEAGNRLQAVTPPRDRPSRVELRRLPFRNGDSKVWSQLLGNDLRVLRPQEHKLPKLRFLLGGGEVSRFVEDSGIVAKGFEVIGVFARGGLSNVWGAGASYFGERELSNLPFPASELKPSVRAVAERIGISGSTTDDLAGFHGLDFSIQEPLPLSPLTRAILDRYERHRDVLTLRMGHSRLAVLSADRGTRRKCNLEGMCAYGCTGKSIYNSADDLTELESYDNFTCHDNARVTRIERQPDGYAVRTAGNASQPGPVYRAPTVIVAAGLFNTTRLVLRLLECFDRETPILDGPTAAFGLICPRRLGKGLPPEGLGSAELSFQCDIQSDPHQYVAGSLYAGDHFQASELIRRMPLSYPGARIVARSIMPALLLGTIWFPSRYGKSRARLERAEGDQDHRLVVEGAFTEDFGDIVRSTLKMLRKEFRRLGLYAIPGSVEPFAPGGAARIAGTLPMGSRTTSEGEVVDASNVFVADASSLTCLPPKSVVLTAMANADRIGRIVARRITSNRSQTPVNSEI